MADISRYNVVTAKIVDPDTGPWQRHYVSKLIFVSITSEKPLFDSYHYAWDFHDEKFLGIVLKRRLKFLEFPGDAVKKKRAIRTIRCL